jgi:hypothetical protein
MPTVVSADDRSAVVGIGMEPNHRLDRLGRSTLHLITLGADLRERGIGLKGDHQDVRRRGAAPAPDRVEGVTLSPRPRGRRGFSTA